MVHPTNMLHGSETQSLKISRSGVYLPEVTINGDGHSSNTIKRYCTIVNLKTR